ncbi:transporter substrate-binding domain-containing diguanylate cyclase [Desulfopila aestuarii]|uniref:diguanylate cyclase n=1 Tax=Desulfopila aestuarii DSM 18488 TaxID=1121416 RepID=A0A1M7YIV2_9BACT|nr:sensor domain-containing diguanylate cyclase [Desulfopila aestuarii]SHO52543.1 PAS domain S-box-containing protein/diguanylate cyclase (GGDEF) domain-containing protein [Desulfopila aestuarii DSM 18488]
MALADMPLTNIKISGELPFPSKFALNTSQQIKDFIPIFNKALAAIPQERKNAIWEKWFRIEYEKKMISSLWVQTVLIGAGLLTLCALAIVFFVQRRFKRIKMAVEALDPHLLSVRMDQNVIITEVTEAFCRVTGFDCKDLIGQPLMSLGSPAEDSPNAFHQIWKTLQEGNHWQGEVKLLKKDGSIMWVEAVVSPLRRENDRNDGYTAIYQDVSERKYFENLAIRDELTGLFNRRHFNDIGPVLLRRAQEEHGIFALILLDVDNFKKYNDNYGHPNGDKVLSAIGAELRRVFQRHDDMVFRMGGEEFGAVVVMSHPDDVVLCTQKILSCIRGLNILHKYNPPGIVTVSIGVCTIKDFTDYDDIGRIYQVADEALYQAKSAGRNQICLKSAENINGDFV